MICSIKGLMLNEFWINNISSNTIKLMKNDIMKQVVLYILSHHFLFLLFFDTVNTVFYAVQ